MEEAMVVAKPSEAKAASSSSSSSSWLKRYKWWLQIAIYTFLVLCGGALGVLLGRLYYEKGGKSNWLSSLVQVVGFPIVIPFFFVATRTKPGGSPGETLPTGSDSWILSTQLRFRARNPSLILASVYVSLGVFLAADCMLYSVGLMYLPVTTYTVISASQLGFNALFSFFLNKQKFTPYVINSVVLLTVSALLLVFTPEPGSSSGEGPSREHYIVGFVCTLAASAGYGLLLSLTQLVFQRIIKGEGFRDVLNMSFYQGLVASVTILIGLFTSGEWKSLTKEMNEFELGKVSYVMDLVWIALGWQGFNVGYVGLIFKVSSLFSNVISMLSLPIAPIFAVFFFNDKLTGLKVVSMLLALWGFASYIYQHYLDDDVKANKGEEKLPTPMGVPMAAVVAGTISSEHESLSSDSRISRMNLFNTSSIF